MPSSASLLAMMGVVSGDRTVQGPSILCLAAAPTRSQGLAPRRKQGNSTRRSGFGGLASRGGPGLFGGKGEQRGRSECASACAAAALRLTKVPALAAGSSSRLLHFFGEGKAKAS
ncbi:unnamed protein product [Symbiodinium sp. CCMP2592]|nr:unnamed protein product [Symbiodinium sp. CCMP2592]